MGRGVSLFFAIFLATCLQLASSVDLPTQSVEDFSALPGHLEPLGSKNVKLSLEAIQSFPTPIEFFNKYVVPSKPVLIQGGGKTSPALAKWTDEYFMSLPESSDYKVQAEQRKKENRTVSDQKISFLDFVSSYKEKDIYMVSTVPEFIQSDVLLPPSLLCRDITDTMLIDAVMWFSSGGTKSVLHNDVGMENINCLFSGTKEFLFIDYHKYKHVVPIDVPDGAYSSVDVDRVDFEKYPGLIDIEYYNVTMQAGDCLYIPHKWYHQVRSYDRNIAVNLWWQHDPGFVPKEFECENVEQNQTLDKFTFEPMEYEDDDKSEAALLSHLQHYLKKRDKISFKRFVKRMKKDPKMFYEDDDMQWTKELKSTVRAIFKIIDMDKDKYFSTEDLDKLQTSEETMTALINEYYRLNDLIDKQRQENEENDKDDDDDDDDLANGDYDIKPVRKDKDREEL